MVKRRGTAEHDSTNKRDGAIMIFRKKYTSDKEPIDTRTYKSFFSEKSLKVSFFDSKQCLYL